VERVCQQRWRRDEHGLGAKGGQQEDVVGGYPIVQDVADDSDSLPGDYARPAA
jgi:hypothetical protein